MNVYTYAYSVLYEPAAPVVEIGVRGPDPDSREVRIAALVDSGAAATMPPIQVPRAVGARYVETRNIRGVTGLRQPAETFVAVIRIGPHVVPTAEAVALGRNEAAILGRDVLNRLNVTLDGPAQAVEIAE